MTVDEYLDATPEPHRGTLTQLRAMLASILPDAEEGISCGVPAFKVSGKPVAGYAAAKRHCTCFPHSGSVMSQVEPEMLEGYDWAKGKAQRSVGSARWPATSPTTPQRGGPRSSLRRTCSATCWRDQTPSR